MDLPAGLQVSSSGVQLEGVDPKLLAFASQIGVVHRIVFGHDLVITAAKDGIHTTASLHAVGKALDLRTNDKDGEGNALLLHLLSFAANGSPIAYFDERNVPGGPHIHLEWHGA